jgi:hypothetical protein
MLWRSLGEIVDPEAGVSSTIGCSFSTRMGVTGVVVAGGGGASGGGCEGTAGVACEAATAAE